MIRTKMFLILLALVVTIGPRYKVKKEEVKLDKYTELRLDQMYENDYRVLNYQEPVLPEEEEEKEPEKTLREQVEELIVKGKYVLTGYCSCDKCHSSFGGRKAKGLPPNVEITGTKIPGVINLGSYLMKDGVRYVLKDGNLIEYTDIDTYCGKYVECNCKKCNGRHDYFLIRK